MAIALSVVFGLLLIAAYVIKAASTGFVVDDASFSISLVCSQAVGLVLVLRRPDNRVGWIVCLLAWAMSLQEFIESYTQLAAQQQWPLTLAAWIDGKTFLWLWVGVIALFLYFPTGELPSPRWRIPARLAFAGVLFGLIVISVIPGPLLEDPPAGGPNPLNPTAVPVAVWEQVEFLNGVGLLWLVAGLVMALTSLVVRYRHSSGVQRLQIRWVVTAAVAFAAVTLVSVTVRQLRPDLLEAADVAAGLGFVLIPVSIGIAILRFHLYEIDRIVTRTFVYLVLTIVLGAVYVLAVTAARVVTEPVTGDAAVAVAASTLMVAALFQPVRRRVQDAVDRRFNRARYDAATTVQHFSARLRDDVDLESLSVELMGVIRATMQPVGALLWLRDSQA